MTRLYKLNCSEQLAPNHPLHWARFWPDLQRLHRARSEARQDLVLWLANLYYGAVRCGLPVGFCTVQVRLMDLREWVRDYRPALDYFFDIKQRGYHIDEEMYELTTLIPKDLKIEELREVNRTVVQLKYTPPSLPTENTAISKVYLKSNLNKEVLIERVLLGGRPEIVPQLSWLLEQPGEFNFHFVRAGKLKLRDTSVWPISAIENWPSWLRKELFGQSIDLDAAYIQFLLHHLEKIYSATPHMVKLLYPDLVRLLDDKEAFREELCTEVLGLDFTDVNRGLVKQVLMSLANGSRISPTLLTNGSGFSLTAELIVEAAKEATLSDLTEIGYRLQKISAQFANARKVVCVNLLKQSPNRANIKKVFGSYFEWEREARYALWEEVGRHGIMVHDGLDGVPQDQLDRLPELIERLGLRLTA